MMEKDIGAAGAHPAGTGLSSQAIEPSFTVSPVPASIPCAGEREMCQRCWREYRVWFAPSPLWNAVMRGGCINGPWEFSELICANCFMEMAEDRGVADQFRVDAAVVKVPLQKTTPSGRKWDAEQDLWVEADAN